MHPHAASLLRLSRAVVIAAMLSHSASAALHDGSHLNRVGTGFETPHLEWARPLAGGPVRVLFIVPRNLAAREVVELAQRLDLDFRAFTTVHAGELAADNIYEAALTAISPAEKEAELLEALAKPYDAIVLANFAFERLPIEAQYHIVRKVAEGAGLLVTYSRPLPLKKLIACPTNVPAIAASVTALGLPRDLQSMTPERLVSTFAFGKGRICLLPYPGAPHCMYGGLGLTSSQSYSTDWSAQYENNMVLAAQALLWTADRAPRATLQPAWNVTNTLAAEDVLREGLTLHVGLPEASRATLVVRLRDCDNAVLDEQQLAVRITDGRASVLYRPPCWPDGRLTVDAILRTCAGVETFAAWTLPAAGAVGALELSTDRTSYETGMTVRATLRLGALAPSALRIRARLDDLPYGQSWVRLEAELPVGASEAGLTLLPPPRWPAAAGLVRCELLDAAGRLVGRACLPLLFPSRERPIFTTVGWDGVPEVLAPPFAQRLVGEVDWHTSLQWPSPGGTNAIALALFDQRMVPYMTRIMMGADDRGWTLAAGLPSTNTPEARALGGDLSFYNQPGVPDLWRRQIEQRIVNVPECGPVVYNLGDENFFSYDGGYSPSDEIAYRQFLAARYGNLDALNREWEARYADFASVAHLSPRALREGRHFAAWFDHRAFMEQQYADLHHFLARCIKDRDPYAQVGAEGSVPGDIEKTIDTLEFWGPYSDTVEDELLRSIGADRFRTLWWGGYVGSHGGRSDFPVPLWRPLLQGTVNGSAWFSVGIGSEGFLAPDFTYAEYFRRMLPHLQRLQNGLAQLLILQPLRHDGIAILWSHASATATQMDERFFNPRDGAATLLQFCNRRGLTADFVTPSMIATGALARYRVLFLTGASALATADLVRIQSFAEAGGIVVADVNPGILSAHCRLLDSSPAAALFGAPPFDGRAPLELKPWAGSLKLRGQTLALKAAKTWQNPAVPACASRSMGKGAAVLLNAGLGAAANTADPPGAFDVFLLGLLDAAGIRPAVSLAGIDSGQPLLRVREHGGCLTVGLLATTKEMGREVTLTLPREQAVYRADGGFVTHARQVTFTLETPFALFTAFDARQAGPRLTLDRGRIAAGESLRIDAAGLDPEAVYRLELLDPQGASMPRRLRVFAGQGREDDRTVRWAFNDAPGRYTVLLTDVRTGLQGRENVRVRLTP